jgi:sulfur-oxidizing protein SoxA
VPSVRCRSFDGALCALAGLLLVAGCEPRQHGSRAEASIAEPLRMLAQPVSGYAYQAPATQALQDDAFANPGLLWVDLGAELFKQPPASGRPACSSCHDDADLRGAATRYPAYDAELGVLLNVEQRINRCRERQQREKPLPYESEELLALTSFVAAQSRGLPFDVRIDGPARPFFESGRAYFYARRGQLDLACHHCHEIHAGRMLRGDRLSQGQGNGYPAYRLEWQSLGSLHRRLRFCNTGVRAQPLAYGAPEYVNLELFLAWRAADLPIETPAVRR